MRCMEIRKGRESLFGLAILMFIWIAISLEYLGVLQNRYYIFFASILLLVMGYYRDSLNTVSECIGCLYGRSSFYLLILSINIISTNAQNTTISLPERSEEAVGSTDTVELIVTIIIFIILSITANVVCVYYFYWKPHKDELKESTTTTTTNEARSAKETPSSKGATSSKEIASTKETASTSSKCVESSIPKEAPYWNRYLQELVVPISLLIEDMVAISFEDSDKTANVDIAVIIIIQFVFLMMISWFKECLVFSIITKRIPSLLSIMIEYIFSIIFISFSRNVIFAGFIIGGLTMIQVIAEIINIIFDKQTDSCFFLPSICRIFARDSLDSTLSDQERMESILKNCCASRSSRYVIGLSIAHIVFFCFGAIYIQVFGQCYNNSFKYWWVFGMFLFSKVMESKFDSINISNWEKKLMWIYFITLEIFICITTIIIWTTDNNGDTKQCVGDNKAAGFYFYGFFVSGLNLTIFIIIIGGAVIHRKITGE